MIFELNQPSSNGKTKNYEINVPLQKGIQKSNDRRISIVVDLVDLVAGRTQGVRVFPISFPYFYLGKKLSTCKKYKNRT